MTFASASFLTAPLAGLSARVLPTTSRRAAEGNTPSESSMVAPTVRSSTRSGPGNHANGIFSSAARLTCGSMSLSWLLLVLCSTAAQAVDIEETIWGFDGRVVPYQFNPVSLLVSNTTEEPVGVRLELRRSVNAGSDRIGAKLEEAVFLSPFSSRWVQFYPYVTSLHDEWSVHWGFLPSQKKSLPQPNPGGFARVALVNRDQTNSRTSGVKTFPEALFPPFVSATHTLEAVYLDHVPRWQDQRRQALLDWLQAGGTLFLLPSVTGEPLRFTAQLSVLNSPLPKFDVGQGLVIRAVDQDDAGEKGKDRLGPTSHVPPLSSYHFNWAENVFTALKSISLPQHNWFVIHVMSVTYVAIVFPGWYLLSRNTRNHRTTILAFLGVALLFTVGFNLVGRRGYGESTTVNTLAIARHVQDDRYDVESWTNIFVTGGAQYALQHDGEGHLYSCVPLHNERVGGRIDNGREGSFVTDIPIFSSRSFMHRGQSVGPKWDIQVANYLPGETPAIDALEITIAPHPSEQASVYAVFQNRLYHVSRKQDVYRPEAHGTTINESLVRSDFGNQQPNYYDRPQREETDITYSRLTYSAIARSMEVGTRLHVNSDDEQLRILILDDLPESFAVRHPQLQASQGKALYSLDIPLPGPVAPPVDEVYGGDDAYGSDDMGIEAEEAIVEEANLDDVGENLANQTPTADSSESASPQPAEDSTSHDE